MASDQMEQAIADYARSLMSVWGLAGGECDHGLGFAADCPGDEDEPCAWQSVRPLLRQAALAITGDPAPSPAQVGLDALKGAGCDIETKMGLDGKIVFVAYVPLDMLRPVVPDE